MQLAIFENTAQLSAAAAAKAAEIIRVAIAANGRARVVVATGNSQIEFIRLLAEQPDIDWSAVEAFHLDEYVGLPETHPASFRRWVKTRFVDVVHPGAAHLIDGNAADLDAELRRYADLLNAAPIDVGFVGFGE